MYLLLRNCKQSYMFSGFGLGVTDLDPQTQDRLPHLRLKGGTFSETGHPGPRLRQSRDI